MPDWIKCQISADHPKILRIADLTGDNPFLVLGRMVHWFQWVDRHCSGPHTGISAESLLTIIGNPPQAPHKPDYIAAMSDPRVLWIAIVDGNRVYVKEYQKHFSKSAKQRALSAQRMLRLRCAASVTKTSPRREEKRREEKQQQQPELPPERVTAAAAAFFGLGLDRPTLEWAAEHHSPDALNAAADRMRKERDRNGLDNPSGFLRRILQGGVSIPVEKPKRAKPTPRPAPVIDAAELTRKSIEAARERDKQLGQVATEETP